MADDPSSELPPNERPKTAQGGGWGAEPVSQRGGLQRFFWPAMLILAGLVFFAENTGLLPPGMGESGDWIMLFAGGLLFGGALLQTINPGLGRPSVFWMIAGAVLMVLGLSEILAVSLDFSQWWPLLLIGIGLVMLVRGLR